MRAAVLSDVPGRLEIEELTVADPGPGEVLVEVAASGLCHSDLHCIDGALPVRTPIVLGHEAAGVVAAVGEGVRELQVGDRVVTCLSIFCGSCRQCLSGRSYLCESPPRARGAQRLRRRDGGAVGQFFGLGAFAEQMLVHERSVAVVPSQVPLDRAALLGCAVTTGLGAVFNSARVEPGSTVVVFGCGGVGLNCVQGAAIAGATAVIAVDRARDKLDLARTFGATATVDASTENVVDAVRQITDGGVDFSFEAIGLRATVQQAVAVLRPGGTATIVGMMRAGEQIEVPFEEIVVRGKRLHGAVMGENHFRLDIPRYAELYLQDRLRLDELITARIALDDVNDAMEAMRAGAGTRSVIVFGS